MAELEESKKELEPPELNTIKSSAYPTMPILNRT